MASLAFSNKQFLVIVVLASFALSCLLVQPSYGQVAGATLSGAVKDPSGAAIPMAQVSIKNVATGVTRNLTTDSVGFYSAPNLLPGDYEVTFTAQGFAREVRTGVNLDVGAQQVLDATMRVGQISQAVEVTTEAPLVQLTSSAITGDVNATTVRELPLNGRSWTDLATLQPGVASVQTHAPQSNRGFGSEVTISGGRPQENNYRLDGVTVNDYMNGAPGNVLGGDLGVDAIQEFKVLTSNYSAEYGRTSGGVVNAITRSGTNSFHGSAYEFLRNSALDTRNFFDGPTVPPFKRNEFGASAGGPIHKDKIFIFGNYEGIRQSKTITTVPTVPSLAARQGIIRDSSGNPEDQHGCSFQGWTQTNGCPKSGASIVPLTMQSQCAPEGNGATSHLLAPGQAGFCVDDSAAKYLTFWPTPTANSPLLGSGNTALVSFPSPTIVAENFGTLRADWKFSEKDSVFVTYLNEDNPQTVPDPLNDVLDNNHIKRQTVALEETHVFGSAFVNSARVGYNRVYAANDDNVGAINAASSDTSLTSDPGRTASQVYTGQITHFMGSTLSANGNTWVWNSYQFYDDAFWTHGAHSTKFGFAVEHMQTADAARTEPGGLWHFGSLTAFLTNQPTAFETGIASTQGPRNMRQTLFGGYIQDDWRLRPNLTLNLGLRYEMVTVPTEADNHISLLPQITSPQFRLGSPAYGNATERDFSPRVGFAWDPFGNQKTAVRGGFGIFDTLPLPYETTILFSNAAPYASLFNKPKIPGGAFYQGGFGLLQAGQNEASFIEQNPHRSYVMQWNLSIQRQLAPSLAAVVGYVGSHGVHQQFRSDDINFVLPVSTSAGYLWPVPVGNGAVLNQNFGEIRGVMWPMSTSYHALQVGVQKKMSHGVQLQTSFTWGKSIDEGSSSGFGDSFTNSISSEHWFDLKLSRGLSDFNVGRSLVINVIWDVPAPKFSLQPFSWGLSGWEFGGIVTVRDGTPFSATFGTDGDPLGMNSTDPWDFPNRLTGPGCATLTNPGNPNNYVKTQCFAIPTAPDVNFFNSGGGIGCDPAFGSTTKGDPNYLWCFNLRGNAGRNILIGPGESNLDFSLYKNNPIRRISESFNVQFRAEIFNILNHPNFAVPVNQTNTDIFASDGTSNAAAGVLTSTSTDSRQIQFALKLIW